MGTPRAMSARRARRRSVCYPRAMVEDVAPDPHLWLEDVQGDAALAWVRERNAHARKALEAHPDFPAMRTRIRAVLDARDRIPMVTRRGAWLYNFWQDAENPRGLWRRTSLDQYRKEVPQWQTLL